jgi:hypothetical protein
VAGAFLRKGTVGNQRAHTKVYNIIKLSIRAEIIIHIAPKREKIKGLHAKVVITRPFYVFSPTANYFPDHN